MRFGLIDCEQRLKVEFTMFATIKIQVETGRISGRGGRGYDRGAEWSSGRIMGRRVRFALYSGSIPLESLNSIVHYDGYDYFIVSP